MNNTIEKEMTMFELASILDMNLDNPEIYDLSWSGLQVESTNVDGNLVFKDIESFMVKPKVGEYYQLGDLRGTSNHRVLEGSDFIKLKDHPNAVKMNGEMNVVDITVTDTERYIANGYVNHNTTSGGIS
jgi:hypothetical protein